MQMQCHLVVNIFVSINARVYDRICKSWRLPISPSGAEDFPSAPAVLVSEQLIRSMSFLSVWLIVSSLQEEKEQLIEYRSTVANLVGRAKTVVQLRPRSAETPLRATTPIRAICDYRQIEVGHPPQIIRMWGSRMCKYCIFSPSSPLTSPFFCCHQRRLLSASLLLTKLLHNHLAVWDELLPPCCEMYLGFVLNQWKHPNSHEVFRRLTASSVRPREAQWSWPKTWAFTLFSTDNSAKMTQNSQKKCKSKDLWLWLSHSAAVSSENLKANQLYICPILLAVCWRGHSAAPDTAIFSQPGRFCHWSRLHVRSCVQVKEEGALVRPQNWKS